METARNYIAGIWSTPGASAHDGLSMNPATGEAAARFVDATRSDVDHAVAAARESFEKTAWAQSPKLRSDVLLRFANTLETQSAAIVKWLVTLNGKLRREAEGEVHAAVSELRYYAGLARNLFGRVLEHEPDKYSMIESEPVGVAAIVVPWNAPVTLLIRSLAPALAVGCAVVKSAPQTALVNDLAMSCLVSDERLPRGIVSWFTGQGAEVSQYLCEHPEVDVISFTGSTRVGKQIAQATAKRLTRLSLELGGKAPAIVMPDADLTRAIKGIVAGACVMSGQMCTAISRILVHESIRDEVANRLQAALKAVRVGPGDEAGSEMGALIDKKNQARLLNDIDEAKRSCVVLLEGVIPPHLPEGGAFLQPSIIATQDLNSRFIQQELFGPIVTFETFHDEDEALHRANATRYGLASSIWSQSAGTARYLARRMKFGNVWVNAHNRLFAEVETGGFRESGVGRLHGVEGLSDFMETKHLYMDFSR